VNIATVLSPILFCHQFCFVCIGLQIVFTQEDYSVPEDRLEFQAGIVKDKVIANPVTMRILPLNRTEVIRRNIPLLDDLIDDERFIDPQYAGDFSIQVLCYVVCAS